LRQSRSRARAHHSRARHQRRPAARALPQRTLPQRTGPRPLSQSCAERRGRPIAVKPSPVSATHPRRIGNFDLLRMRAHIKGWAGVGSFEFCVGSIPRGLRASAAPRHLGGHTLPNLPLRALAPASRTPSFSQSDYFACDEWPRLFARTHVQPGLQASPWSFATAA
jgi:hypothetical protein